MLSDDVDWMDTILKECFYSNGTTAAVWSRIKTALAELGTTPNSAMDEIALPKVGVFILCGIELGLMPSDVSKLYNAVVARLHQ